MSQSDHSLKLRMKATSGVGTPEPAPKETVVYHWGRIFGAVVVLLLLIVLLGWLFWPDAGTDSIRAAASDEQSRTGPAAAGEGRSPENSADANTSTKTYDWEAPSASDTHTQDSDINVPVVGANDTGDSATRPNDSSSASTTVTAPENTESADTGSEMPTEPTSSAKKETTKTALADEPDLTSQPATENSEADATFNAEDQSDKASEQAATGRTPALADVTIQSDHLKRAALSRTLQDKEPGAELPGNVTMNSEGIIRVYFFNELENLKGQTIFHDWYRDGERVARVTIRPYSEEQRASSAKYINRNMLGQWRVKATTKDGELLGSGHFTVAAQDNAH